MVQTDLTVLKIQDSFATPASISFWDLPAFIDTLEKAGFSGVRHRLYWHSLLSDPFLLCAMVLFSAGFALRAAPRRTAVVWTMGGGILTGFLLYFLSDVVAALGQTASVPVALAAWTPAVAAILIGASLLIHVEEG
jgi:lipopolysaccharide export system permease protein